MCAGLRGSGRAALVCGRLEQECLSLPLELLEPCWYESRACSLGWGWTVLQEGESVAVRGPQETINILERKGIFLVQEVGDEGVKTGE